LEIGGKQFSFKLLNTSFSGGREMGVGIGTFGDSVFLALFLVIAFAVLIAALQKGNLESKQQRWMVFALTGLSLASLFFTYSRGSVLLALAAIPLIIYFSGGRKKLLIYLTIGIIALSPVLLFGIAGNSSNSPGYINPKIKYTDPISNIFAVFTSSYVENTMQFSRGAILTEIGGELVSSFKLLGYSPAQEFALEKAATKLFGSNMPINNLPIINDVYWVAFIIYYGIIGLAIFWFILFKLFKGSLFVYRNTPDPYLRIFALAFVAIVILAIPYSFILRTFVFRAWGFYFWLIAGLVFAEWRRLKSLEKQGLPLTSESTTGS
ncbi:MAG: O-antigen ligase family protein, partial [Bacteroidota bacterium]